MPSYDFEWIEAKWRKYWADHKTFRQPSPGEKDFVDRPKLYVLDMFPYPSGAGLHVGHPEGYTATDIVCRYARMKGFNVLHPMGYDAFGLPAEQYAVEHGVHPRETTEANIANIERQIKDFGFSYDWSRRLATTDVAYYRWTQWIFLQLFNAWYDEARQIARPIDELVTMLESGKYVVDPVGTPVPDTADGLDAVLGQRVGTLKWHELPADEQREIIDNQRLAYMAEVPVNWCPKLGTVLANEEVTNEGRSDRGNHPVHRRALKQWMLRITSYADRLLADVDALNWPEPIKIMQRNWIGRSTGANVLFDVVGTTGVGTTGVSPVEGSTGVSPVEVTQAARDLSSRDELNRPLLTAEGFVGMNPYPPGDDSPADLIAHVRNLPHIEVVGATYFATFHVVAAEVLAESERDTVLKACLHWQHDRCQVYAAVVMDNHVHLILRPIENHRLGDVLRSIKSFTAHEINKARGRQGAFWLEESFDHVIRGDGWLTQFIYYMCDNPVKKGLCHRWDQYPWLWVDGSAVRTQIEGKEFGVKVPQASRLCSSSFEEEETHRRDACATFQEEIEVYTTRPDTLFGATYMVLAPEHPLVEQITTPTQAQAVKDYVAVAAGKSELERTADTKEKTGVFTGAHAINPVNDQQIPIWVADYVMMGYGTGAIMAVPAHDTRDDEFAQKFDLPIVQVVQPPDGVDWRGYVDDGVAVNSGPYNGLSTAEFKEKITDWLEDEGKGSFAVNYKLRDWLFSRQRYWGEPFPIVHCETCGAVALNETDLPLELPEMDDFSPATSDDPDAPPQPPLGKLTDWAGTICPGCGGPATRELNTMPQWAGSCWYYLRYLDPDNDAAFVDPEIERYWMSPSEDNPLGGVDLYVGGAEHAVLHLLYARFWHKVLFDLGHVSAPEPFARLFNQGMIRSFAYRDSRNVCIGYEDIDFRDDGPHHKESGEKLVESVEKMSKSLKNVVNPDEVIAKFGADTFRLYEMFMGPLDASKPWNTRDVPGSHRFLQRVWRMINGDAENDLPGMLGEKQDDDVERALARLIKKVGEDYDAMKFNTAIAAMMEFVNTVFKAGTITPSQAGRFVLTLAPMAPHIAEELWQALGNSESLTWAPWPQYDETLLAQETVELAVQVNGKMKGRVTVPADADEDAVIEAVLADAAVAAAVEGKDIVKKIVVPGRLVNFVVVR